MDFKEKMYEDMVDVGLIDRRISVEDYTIEELWQIVMDYFNNKEIF